MQCPRRHSLHNRMGPHSRAPSGPAVSTRLHQQAEDKTAPDQHAETSRSDLQRGSHPDRTLGPDARVDIGAPLRRLKAMNGGGISRRETLGYGLAFAACAGDTGAQRFSSAPIVNDVTQLNPITVAAIRRVTTVDQVCALVRESRGPVSIGGGRFSQGGQTACDGCIQIDTRSMNRIIGVDRPARTITVEPGVTWRQIQEATDPLALSPAIMQSFFNFTIGGSISVNCHGDYVGHGPIIESVRSLDLVLADGAVAVASRGQNPELFSAAIGGYGGIGVIVGATLDLAANDRLERFIQTMAVDDYPNWHRAHVLARTDVVLHHAVLYPRAYDQVLTDICSKTDKPLTEASHLAPQGRADSFSRFLLDVDTFAPFAPALRQYLYDPLTMHTGTVAWRNFIASRDAFSLEPTSRAHSTYVLQEYFVPEGRFRAFVTHLRRILRAHQANVLNVAIRHTKADRTSMLSWAQEDVYSFVLYYQQGVDTVARAEVQRWTRALIDAALAEGGRFYLPYQIQATPRQFEAAYPGARAFFALKREIDPQTKFRNRLWEAYDEGH